MATGDKLVDLNGLKAAYDELDNAKVAKTGDTLTGLLALKPSSDGAAIDLYNPNRTSYVGRLYTAISSSQKGRVGIQVRATDSDSVEYFLLPSPDNPGAVRELLTSVDGARYIDLTGTSPTIASIYNALSVMLVGSTACVTVRDSASLLLTGSGVSASGAINAWLRGTVYRNSTTDFRFNVMTSYGDRLYSFKADITSSSIATNYIFEYVPNSGAPKDIYIANASTFSEIYPYLNTIPVGHSATIYATSAATDTLSGSKINNGSKGYVNRPASGTFDFMVTVAPTCQNMYTWRITGYTSASAVPSIGAIYQHAGTALP